MTPWRIDELARKYFSGVDYTLNFGLLLQLFWGARLLVDKIGRLFKPGASYHKPDLTCPAVFKRADRYMIGKWGWYRNRAWVAAVCFEK